MEKDPKTVLATKKEEESLKNKKDGGSDDDDDPGEDTDTDVNGGNQMTQQQRIDSHLDMTMFRPKNVQCPTTALEVIISAIAFTIFD